MTWLLKPLTLIGEWIANTVDTSYATICSINSKELSCESEDISISGVVLKQVHLDQALANLHASHSDSIGAAKVQELGILDGCIQDICTDPQCELG